MLPCLCFINSSIVDDGWTCIKTKQRVSFVIIEIPEILENASWGRCGCMVVLKTHFPNLFMMSKPQRTFKSDRSQKTWNWKGRVPTNYRGPIHLTNSSITWTWNDSFKSQDLFPDVRVLAFSDPSPTVIGELPYQRIQTARNKMVQQTSLCVWLPATFLGIKFFLG